MKNYPRELTTIGDHIRKHRLDLGLEQQDVAELVGAGRETVSSWENRHTEPTPERLPAVVRFLGYPPVPPDCSWGRRMALMRRAAGLSHVALARVMGMAPYTVLAWEHQPDGRRKARQARLEAYLQSELARLLPGSIP